MANAAQTKESIAPAARVHRHGHTTRQRLLCTSPVFNLINQALLSSRLPDNRRCGEASSNRDRSGEAQVESSALTKCNPREPCRR